MAWTNDAAKCLNYVINVVCQKLDNFPEGRSLEGKVYNAQESVDQNGMPMSDSEKHCKCSPKIFMWLY